MKLRKYFSLVILLLLAGNVLLAQTGEDDDLLSALGEDTQVDYANAAFKTDRVINLHSLENTAPGVLDFKISHRFGFVNQGFYDFFGLDNASMRLGFDFGLTSRLAVGIGRASYQKTYDGFFKYKIFRQHSGAKHFPLTVAYVATVAVNTLRSTPDETIFPKSRRLNYTHQLIIGRKFSERISFEVVPALVHHNLVDKKSYDNDVIYLGLAGRVKLSKRIAVNVEYIPRIAGNWDSRYTDSFSVGFDIETGGHVFQLHFTNSTPMTDHGFLSETTGKWSEGGVHFGFNISRVFTLYEPK